MPIDIGLEDLCIDPAVDLSLDGLSILFPGGFSIEASLPSVDVAIAADWAKALLGQINTALLPLAPLFNILDVVLLIFEFVQAVPDAITKLSVGALLEIVPKIKAKVGKLLVMIPPLSIPIMLKGILNVLVVFLTGLEVQLRAILRALQGIDLALERAASLQGISIDASVELTAAANCARVTADASVNGMGQGLGPIGTLMGIMAMLVEISGLPIEIPGMISVSAGDTAALEAQIDAIDILVTVLGTVNDAIPL